MMRAHVTLAALGAAIALLALSPPGEAQTVNPSDVVQGEVRPGWRTSDGTHMAALHLQLAEGWKTYWRAPGDAGIPPRFDWSGSRNIAAVRFHWPRPSVFEQLGMRSIGYLEELVLPMEFTLRDPAATAEVAATVELGVCETICIPVTLQVRAELPPGGAADGTIDAALASRPQSARAVGLSSAECEVEAISDGVRVRAQLRMPRIGRDEVAVFELADKSVWVSDTVSERHGEMLNISADMVPPDGRPFALDRSELRITVLGEDRAAELQGCSSR